jgi:uncharacterized repeat protein (TIGR01451 family)
VLLSTVCSLALLPTADAAPKLRFQIDQRGDMLLFGNTVGYDCRPGIPAPVAGDVDAANCGLFLNDSSADAWWRSDEPTAGRATANTNITNSSARSTAMLELPAGAQVTYARLYASATYDEAILPSGIVQFERPGVFMQMLTALPNDIERNIVGGATYQASFDVTALLQKHGAGAYRVAGVPSLGATNVNSDVNYAAWAIVVVYRRDADPIRNISVFDGLTGVGGGQQVDLPIAGFRVPSAGAPDAKLGVIAFEGDHDKSMDSLLWNGTKLSDGSPGSEDNFFNSSRLNKGQPVSTLGDLPRMTGEPASMIGLDLDIVDVSRLVMPGESSAALAVRSLADDVIFIGALATSITSNKPIIETILASQPAGKARPGDPIEFTSTTRNIGNDIGNDVVIRHVLPPELEYVPGTCEIVAGPGSGKKTDTVGDDHCDIVETTDPNTMKPTKAIVVRIGNGAGPTTGGTLAPNDAPIVVKYRMKVKDDAPPGEIPVRSTTETKPPGSNLPTGFPSCAPTAPCAPTVILIPPCTSAIDCGTTKPYCDTTGTGGTAPKGQCTDRCKTTADCVGFIGGEVCDTARGVCVQCTTGGQNDACTADGLGKACLPTSNKCGCASDADCGGRTCSMGKCPAPKSDLYVEVLQTPEPVGPDMPVTYQVDIGNRGPARDPGPLRVTFDIPPSSGGSIETIEPGPGWRCTQQGRSVSCTRPTPLPANDRSTAVKVTVRPYDPANPADPNHPQNSKRQDPPTVQVRATATSDGAEDPNPGDNSAYRLTAFGDGMFRIAGGGSGCAMGQEGSQSSLWALSAAAVVLLVGLSRARRRSAQA